MGKRERIALVGAHDAVEIAGGVAQRARERAVVADVRHPDVARAARHPAIGALEADDAAERRGDAERAARIRAGRERHQAERYRRGRSAARTAGSEIGIPGIATHPVQQRRRERRGAHFGRRREADRNGARLTQARHLRGGGGGDAVGEDACRHRVRPARHVLELLHAERDAGEAAGVVAARDTGVDLARRCARACGIAKHERADPVVQSLDAVEMVLEHLGGAELARADGVGDLTRRARVQRRCRHWPRRGGTRPRNDSGPIKRSTMLSMRGPRRSV